MADTACHDEARALFGLDAADGLQGHARAVLERPTVAALARAGGKQLAEQVAMACLHVDSVESRLPAQVGAAHERFGNAVEVFVVHDRIIGRDLHASIIVRVERDDFGLRLAVGLREAPRMRELRDEGDVRMRRFQLVDETLPRIEVGRGDDERMRTGQPVFFQRAGSDGACTRLAHRRGRRLVLRAAAPRLRSSTAGRRPECRRADREPRHLPPKVACARRFAAAGPVRS